MSNNPTNVDTLWKAYQQDRSIRTRNLLVEHYLPLVDMAVRKLLKGGAGGGQDADDLRSAGTVGLINAVERFQPERGLKFVTYSSHRIRGAIIDEIREQDWLGRSARQRASEWLNAVGKLTAVAGRPPTDEEVRTALGWTPGQYSPARTAAAAMFTSIDAARPGEVDDWDRTPVQSLVDTREVDPSEALTHRDEVATLLGTLSTRRRQAVTLRFLHGMSIKELGRAMGIGPEAACGISGRGIEALREHVQEERLAA